MTKQLALVHPPGNGDQHEPEWVEESLRIQSPLSRPPGCHKEPSQIHIDPVLGPYGNNYSPPGSVALGAAHPRVTVLGGATRLIIRIPQPVMVAATLLLLVGAGVAQEKRYVVIDQDAAGPGGTDMMSILVLLQSPNVQTLGITVVTGDQWRNEEVAHTLRLLELVGPANIPVAPGAVYPLVRTQAETKLWEQQYGKVTYQGAWTRRESNHDPAEVPAMAEGKPAKLPLNEDAAHFLVRMVHEHPPE